MPKLPIYDTRMLALMRHCISTGKAEHQKDFLETIGFNPTNLKQVRKPMGTKGRQSFTIEQMTAACKKYKISMDWICGLSNEMNLTKKRTPAEQLEDAVMAVKAQLKKV